MEEIIVLSIADTLFYSALSENRDMGINKRKLVILRGF